MIPISKERIKHLLRVYTGGMATSEEEQELYRWIETVENKDIFADYIREIIQDIPSDEIVLDVDWEKIYDRIWAKIYLSDQKKTKNPGRSIVWYQVAAAIGLILLLSAGVQLFMDKTGQSTYEISDVKRSYTENTGRGRPKAVLSTGDSQAVLDEKDTSFLLGGNPVRITRGQIKIAREEPKQYTLTTPHGTTYQVKLADGTMVWLNAGSKLVYPSAFTMATRQVTLEGEAYFDVADDPCHPFIVHAAGQKIEVLGTAFNIEAYRDEQNVITTLVRGKIKVDAGINSVQLQPGQQTRWDRTDSFLIDKNADIEQVIAWKNGYFRFQKADIKTIMQEMVRWYDIKVSYDPGLKPHCFRMLIGRDNDLSEVLQMLEATNEVHFEVAGKRIKVKP